jgi:hypothetical protein
VRSFKQYNALVRAHLPPGLSPRSSIIATTPITSAEMPHTTCTTSSISTKANAYTPVPVLPVTCPIRHCVSSGKRARRLLPAAHVTANRVLRTTYEILAKILMRKRHLDHIGVDERIVLLHVHPLLGNGLVNNFREDRFLLNSPLLGHATI